MLLTTYMTTIIILVDGIPVSVGVGVILPGIRTAPGIPGIGTLGTTPDIIHGIAVLIGDGAEVGTPDGTVDGQAVGAGQADGAEAGTPDHTETMSIMADQPIADTDAVTMTDILQEEAPMDGVQITDTAPVAEHLTADTVQAEEHPLDDTAAIMFARQVVTVPDGLLLLTEDIAQEDAVLLQENQV